MALSRLMALLQDAPPANGGANSMLTLVCGGLAVILIKGFTPVPYMLVTLASGIAHFSFPVFVGASIVTRGGRFFLEAALLQHPQAKAVIDRYFYWLAGAGIALIIGAFVLLKLLGGG